MRYASDYYNKMNKFSNAPSNMNRLAKDIERWQKQSIRFKRTYKDFDYSIMIDPRTEIDEDRFSAIEEVFLKFCKEIDEISKESVKFKDYYKYKAWFDENYPELEKSDVDNFTFNWNYYYGKYKLECKGICKNKQELANIAVKLCYERYPNKNKKFIWKVAADGVLLNLKQKNIYLPQKDSSGSLEYLGKSYKMMEVLNLDK